MKNFAVLILTLFLCGNLSAQTKRALTIFIGNYAELNGKGWKKISSVNDTALVLPALRKQGFKDENIDVLLNEQATRLGVDQAFEYLISITKPNDIIVVHISAHGEQIQDNDGDEIDGLDESIVTFNAISPRYFLEDKTLDYEKEIKNYLRDDQLGKYLESIRKNAGPKGEVLVIMDNCHSGSGTRDVSTVVRGGEPAIVLKKKDISSTKDQSVSVDKVIDEKNLAPYTVVSASRADELNQEVKINNVGYGSLSYAVSKALNNLNSNSTYLGFYSEVQSVMNLEVPQQHPVVEGNSQTKKFWGGAFLSKPSFFNIIDAQFSNEFTIDGGLTSGLTVGTTVYLYPSDTYDISKAKCIDTGTITSLKNFQATVVPKHSLNNSNCWVFVKELYFPLDKFSVQFDGISAERIAFYKSALTIIPEYDPAAEAQLIVTIRNKKEVLLNKKMDYAIDTLNPSSTPANVQKLVNRYIKSESIRNYVMNEKNTFYEVELYAHDKSTKITDTLNTLRVNGVTTIKAGTSVVVRFTNKNTKPVFFNILDIQPDSKINAIMPNARAKNGAITSEDLKVEAGQTKYFEIYPVNIGKPYGDETFKIYVGTKSFDLQYLASEDDRTGRSLNKDEAVFNYNFVITK